MALLNFFPKLSLSDAEKGFLGGMAVGAVVGSAITQQRLERKRSEQELKIENFARVKTYLLKECRNRDLNDDAIERFLGELPTELNLDSRAEHRGEIAVLFESDNNPGSFDFYHFASGEIANHLKNAHSKLIIWGRDRVKNAPFRKGESGDLKASVAIFYSKLFQKLAAKEQLLGSERGVKFLEAVAAAVDATLRDKSIDKTRDTDPGKTLADKFSELLHKDLHPAIAKARHEASDTACVEYLKRITQITSSALSELVDVFAISTSEKEIARLTADPTALSKRGWGEQEGTLWQAIIYFIIGRPMRDLQGDNVEESKRSESFEMGVDQDKVSKLQHFLGILSTESEGEDQLTAFLRNLKQVVVKGGVATIQDARSKTFTLDSGISTYLTTPTAWPDFIKKIELLAYTVQTAVMLRNFQKKVIKIAKNRGDDGVYGEEAQTFKLLIPVNLAVHEKLEQSACEIIAYVERVRTERRAGGDSIRGKTKRRITGRGGDDKVIKNISRASEEKARLVSRNKEIEEATGGLKAAFSVWTAQHGEDKIDLMDKVALSEEVQNAETIAALSSRSVTLRSNPLTILWAIRDELRKIESTPGSSREYKASAATSDPARRVLGDSGAISASSAGGNGRSGGGSTYPSLSEDTFPETKHDGAPGRPRSKPVAIPVRLPMSQSAQPSSVSLSSMGQDPLISPQPSASGAVTGSPLLSPHREGNGFVSSSLSAAPSLDPGLLYSVIADLKTTMINNDKAHERELSRLNTAFERKFSQQENELQLLGAQVAELSQGSRESTARLAMAFEDKLARQERELQTLRAQATQASQQTAGTLAMLQEEIKSTNQNVLMVRQGQLEESKRTQLMQLTAQSLLQSAHSEFANSAMGVGAVEDNILNPVAGHLQ